MYAIIETGGKQYKVEEGLKLSVERINAEPGSEITVDKVLLVGRGDDVKVGAPYVNGAAVKCEVVNHARGKKIIVFKSRRRKDSKTKKGHRQELTTLKVKNIQA